MLTCLPARVVVTRAIKVGSKAEGDRAEGG
jgi:hypothetical protein